MYNSGKVRFRMYNSVLVLWSLPSSYISQKPRRIITRPCVEEVGPRFRCINPDNCKPELIKDLQEMVICGPGGIGICCPVISNLNLNQCGVRVPNMYQPNPFVHNMEVSTYHDMLRHTSTFPGPVHDAFGYEAINFGYLRARSEQSAPFASETSNSSLHEIHYQQPKVRVVEDSIATKEHDNNSKKVEDWYERLPASQITKSNSDSENLNDSINMKNKIEILIQRMGGMEAICIEIPNLAKVLIEELNKQCPGPAPFAVGLPRQETSGPRELLAFYPDYEIPWGRYRREVKGNETDWKGMYIQTREYLKNIYEMMTEIRSKQSFALDSDAEIKLNPPFSRQELELLVYGQPPSTRLILSSNGKTDNGNHSNETLLDNSSHSSYGSVHARTNKDGTYRNFENIDQKILGHFTNGKHREVDGVFLERNVHNSFKLPKIYENNDQKIPGNSQKLKDTKLSPRKSIEGELDVEFLGKSNQKEFSKQQDSSKNKQWEIEERENHQNITQEEVFEHSQSRIKMQERIEGTEFDQKINQNNANKKQFPSGSEMWNDRRTGLGLINSEIKLHETINRGIEMTDLGSKGLNYKSQKIEISGNSGSGMNDADKKMTIEKSKNTNFQQNFNLEVNQKAANGENLMNDGTTDVNVQFLESKGSRTETHSGNKNADLRKEEQYSERDVRLEYKTSEIPIRVQGEESNLKAPGEIAEIIFPSSVFEDKAEKTSILNIRNEDDIKIKKEKTETPLNLSFQVFKNGNLYKNAESSIKREPDSSDISFQESDLNHNEGETVIQFRNENNRFELVDGKFVFHSSNLDDKATGILLQSQSKQDPQNQIYEHFATVKSFLKVHDKTPEIHVNPLHENNTYKIKQQFQSLKTRNEGEEIIVQLKTEEDSSNTEKGTGIYFLSSDIEDKVEKTAIQTQTENNDSKVEGNADIAFQSSSLNGKVEEIIIPIKSEEDGSNTEGSPSIVLHSSGTKGEMEKIAIQPRTEKNFTIGKNVEITFQSSNISNKGEGLVMKLNTGEDGSNTEESTGIIFHSSSMDSKPEKIAIPPGKVEVDSKIKKNADIAFKTPNIKTNGEGMIIQLHNAKISSKTEENGDIVSYFSGTDDKGEKTAIQPRTEEDDFTIRKSADVAFQSSNASSQAKRKGVVIQLKTQENNSKLKESTDIDFHSSNTESNGERNTIQPRIKEANSKKGENAGVTILSSIAKDKSEAIMIQFKTQEDDLKVEKADGTDIHSSNTEDKDEEIPNRHTTEENVSKTGESGGITFQSSNTGGKREEIKIQPKNYDISKDGIVSIVNDGIVFNFSNSGNRSEDMVVTPETKGGDFKNSSISSHSTNTNATDVRIRIQLKTEKDDSKTEQDAGIDHHSSYNEEKTEKVSFHLRTEKDYFKIGEKPNIPIQSSKDEKMSIRHETEKDGFKTRNGNSKTAFKSLNMMGKISESDIHRNKMDVLQERDTTLEIPANLSNLEIKAANIQTGEDVLRIESEITTHSAEDDIAEMTVQPFYNNKEVNFKKGEANAGISIDAPRSRDEAVKVVNNLGIIDLYKSEGSAENVFSFPSLGNRSSKNLIQDRIETDTFNKMRMHFEITSDSIDLKDKTSKTPTRHENIGTFSYKGYLYIGTEFPLLNVEKMSEEAEIEKETINLKNGGSSHFSFQSSNMNDEIVNARAQIVREGDRKDSSKIKFKISEGDGKVPRTVIQFKESNYNEEKEGTDESEIESLNIQEKVGKEDFNQKNNSKDVDMIEELSFGAQNKFNVTEVSGYHRNNMNGNRDFSLLEKATYPIPNPEKESFHSKHIHSKIKSKEQDLIQTFFHTNKDELEVQEKYREDGEMTQKLLGSDHQSDSSISRSAITSEQNTSNASPESIGEIISSFTSMNTDVKDRFRQGEIIHSEEEIDLYGPPPHPIEAVQHQLSVSKESESIRNVNDSSSTFSTIPPQNIAKDFDIILTDSGNMNLGSDLDQENISFDLKGNLHLAQKATISNQNEKKGKYMITELPKGIDFTSHSATGKANDFKISAIMYDTPSLKLLKSSERKASEFQLLPVVQNQEIYFSTTTNPQHSAEIFVTQNFKETEIVKSSFLSSDEGNSELKSPKLKITNLNGGGVFVETATVNKHLTAKDKLEGVKSFESMDGIVRSSGSMIKKIPKPISSVNFQINNRFGSLPSLRIGRNVKTSKYIENKAKKQDITNVRKRFKNDRKLNSVYRVISKQNNRYHQRAGISYESKNDIYLKNKARLRFKNQKAKSANSKQRHGTHNIPKHIYTNLQVATKTSQKDISRLSRLNTTREKIYKKHHRQVRDAEKPEIQIEVDDTKPKKTLNLKIVYGKVETPYWPNETNPLSDLDISSEDKEFEKILRLGYRNHLLNKGKVALLHLNKNFRVYKPDEVEEESSEDDVIGHRINSSSHQPQFVIGGRNEDTPWPWVVGIYERDSTKFVCGGTLFNAQHVLSAAHCFAKFPKYFRFVVVVGSLDRWDRKKTNTGGKLYEVKQLFVHEGFRMECYCNDIAVLRLELPLALDVMPACLPHFDPAGVGEFVTVLGWGDTAFHSEKRKNGMGTTVLQRVDGLTIVNPIDCRRIMSSISDRNLPDNFGEYYVCAGVPDGSKDACIGDSGGPLLHEDYDGMWSLVGIVSFGYKCGEPGIPGTYSRISYYIPWITDVVNNH
ncbi:clotting factor B [Nephila pilipes]|uniref:Clotting factor B n=1 Tax=Nephila pilipes TaxID=299642 RepID=A0A8X6PQJ5_NEPPI|nr:clotting factor B [Nephila pilipes]